MQVIDLMIDEMDLLIKPIPGNHCQGKKHQDKDPEKGPGIGIKDGHRIDFFVDTNLQSCLREFQKTNRYKGGTCRGTKGGQQKAPRRGRTSLASRNRIFKVTLETNRF